MNKFIIRSLLLAVISITIGILIAAYLFPYEFHAEYLPDKTVYENTPVNAREFHVYTTSRLGRVQEVEDYRLSADTVDQYGLIQVTSDTLDMSVVVDLQVVKIASSDISYNDVCYEDEMDSYRTDVSEFIIYEDGSMKTVRQNLLNVNCRQLDKDSMKIVAVGTSGIYEKEFPLITVESITTRDKLSTGKTLTADKLDLTIHYSDGSIASASDMTDEENTITSDKIKKTKAGTNKLTCYYNNKKYVVKVNCYKPEIKEKKPSVTFDNYGTFELQYSKAYDVGVSRLNVSDGVEYFNNHRETFYSQNVLAGTALYIPGRHVAEDGTVRDQDGYICLAADFSFCEKYSVVLTTLGPGKVYDTGCPYGTVDLYVTW